jgi:hypothetical protein
MAAATWLASWVSGIRGGVFAVLGGGERRASEADASPPEVDTPLRIRGTEGREVETLLLAAVGPSAPGRFAVESPPIPFAVDPSGSLSGGSGVMAEASSNSVPPTVGGSAEVGGEGAEGGVGRLGGWVSGGRSPLGAAEGTASRADDTESLGSVS